MAASPEPNIGKSHSLEKVTRVTLPQKKAELPSAGLEQSMEAILAEVNRISESTQAKPDEQWRDAGSTGVISGTTASASGSVSARQQAIAQLPSQKIMQKQLKKHIHKEVKQLRKQALKIAHMGHPGSAYRLNELYARMRNLNALLTELLEASYDVIRRFFIRVFIDKQQIL